MSERRRRFWSPQPNVTGRGVVASYGWSFWAVVVAIGLFAGLAGAALMKLLQALEHLAWSYSSGSFLHAVERVSAGRHILILGIAGVVAGVGAIAIRQMRGFGGGEVSEALWLEDARLSFGLSAARGLLSIVVVALGASLGREAAPQLTGAAFASRVCDRIGLPGWQRRLLVACGAGAGMAAVYNVPLGGALFALEVLLGAVTLPFVLPALATSLIATAIAWVWLPRSPYYAIPSYGVASSQIVWAAIVGPLAGVAAVAWARVVKRIHRLKPSGAARLAAPVAVFLALGALSIQYPQLLGNGSDTVQLALVGALGVGLAAQLVFLKPAATAGCLGSGAPGGLFTPTLTFGVLIGDVLGHAWSVIWPGAPAGSYALIGGGAVLAAAMQAPLAAIVLVLELTQQPGGLMVPLLLAVSAATVVARVVGAPSIYSARLDEPDPVTGPSYDFAGPASTAELEEWLAERSEPPATRR